MTNIITLDNSSPSALADTVQRLDRDTQALIANALREVQSASNEARILDAVREVLARDLPGRQAVGALFSSSISNCGFFYNLDPTAQVLCLDGTITKVDFDQLITLFDEQWDVVGVNSTVLVDLQRGHVTFGDYTPDLHQELDVPVPASQAARA